MLCLFSIEINLKCLCFVFKEPLDFPVFVAVGEDVTLRCFGNVPPDNPWEDIDIHWLKDDREVLRFTSGKIDVNVDNSHMSLAVREEMSRGIFSLNIRSVRAQDQGVYQCRYKSTDHEDLQNGLPETQTLTVLGMNPALLLPLFYLFTLIMLLEIYEYQNE